jgi:Family of unknown function (DUF6282)
MGRDTNAWGVLRTALCALAAVLCAPPTIGSGQSAADNPDRLLAGAIDIHVHTSPDSAERSVDGIEAAVMARAHGMRAIVLKNHYDPTAPLAYTVRRQVPGIEVFGGVDLNLPVGGMNPAAVQHMTDVLGGFGRIVWMSTFDAENQVRYSKENRPFVSVSQSGALLPATRDVVQVIARRGLVLATGHVSPAEVLLLLREGKRQGVRHMVVTHAMNPPVLMNVAQMQEAAREGGLIEFVGASMRSADASERVARIVEAIRAIGPQFCVLSSDLGQKSNPLPAEGFGAFLAALHARGFSEAELDVMSKKNPATLLGLQ